MTTMISIHPQGNVKDASLFLHSRDKAVVADNRNCFTITFSSIERASADASPYYTASTEITLFGLPDVTAQALHAIVKLSEHGRREVLPTLIDALEREGF